MVALGFIIEQIFFLTLDLISLSEYLRQFYRAYRIRKQSNLNDAIEQQRARLGKIHLILRYVGASSSALSFIVFLDFHSFWFYPYWTVSILANTITFLLYLGSLLLVVLSSQVLFKVVQGSLPIGYTILGGTLLLCSFLWGCANPVVEWYVDTRLPRGLYLLYLAMVGLTFAICLTITTRSLQQSLKLHEATQSQARRNAISVKFRSFVILSRLVSGAFLIAASYQLITTVDLLQHKDQQPAHDTPDTFTASAALGWIQAVCAFFPAWYSKQSLDQQPPATQQVVHHEDSLVGSVRVRISANNNTGGGGGYLGGSLAKNNGKTGPPSTNGRPATTPNGTLPAPTPIGTAGRAWPPFANNGNTTNNTTGSVGTSRETSRLAPAASSAAAATGATVGGGGGTSPYGLPSPPHTGTNAHAPSPFSIVNGNNGTGSHRSPHGTLGHLAATTSAGTPSPRPISPHIPTVAISMVPEGSINTELVSVTSSARRHGAGAYHHGGEASPRYLPPLHHTPTAATNDNGDTTNNVPSSSSHAKVTTASSPPPPIAATITIATVPTTAVAVTSGAGAASSSSSPVPPSSSAAATSSKPPMDIFARRFANMDRRASRAASRSSSPGHHGHGHSHGSGTNSNKVHPLSPDHS